MRSRFNRSGIQAITALSIGLGALTSGANAQSLTWLGVPPNYTGSKALDVSHDGTVVVGFLYDDYGNKRAFRWTQAGGIQDIGGSYAYGVSANGSVVVGIVGAGYESFAFRWTPTDGIQMIPNTLGGVYSEANDVSADGSVVVGGANNASYFHNRRTMRWTQAGGMQDLGTLGGHVSWAHSVSADGTIAAGRSHNAAFQWRAFRWTQAGGMQDLGTLGGDASWACSISADGAVVVGASTIDSVIHRAFRWTQTGGMQDLGTLGGVWSEAIGVSGDGAEVVGWSYNANGSYRGFRWTQAGGMQDLSQTYANLLTNGSYLAIAYAISPDGRYIVGEGHNAATRRTEAFLLDTGPRCAAHNGDVDYNGCVDDADLLAVLFAFGGSGQNLGRVDVNCDATVDDADLLQVLFSFGAGCN